MSDEWERQVAALRKAIADNKHAMEDMRGLINDLRKRLAHYETADPSPPPVQAAQTSQARTSAKTARNRTFN